MKIYASFVTYHPDEKRFKEAYESVAPQVDKVIVIDNTLHNRGIAYALNRAFEQAEAEGCDWLITFDQDSIAPEGLVGRLYDDIKNKDKVGQIGPAYSGYKSEKDGIVNESHIITSGSLTSVVAWRAIGGFKEDYFVDYVDIEFSLRLRKFGYIVLMDTNITLDHRLGEGLVGWDIFGKKRLGFVDHVPVRWYYIVRNCSTMCRDYMKIFPEFVASARHFTFRSVLRMMINGRDRVPRIRMVHKGLKDSRKGKMGEYGE